MKPCQFTLALSLFCGVFTTLTSTNGSCGFFLVLIEQERGDGRFNRPEVYTSYDGASEQMEIVCQGMALLPSVVLRVGDHHPDEMGRAFGNLQTEPRDSLKADC